jgi:2-aminophenol/2-amino-5-chlorophenol 1,6-dioxygenase beta subunit
MAQGASSPASSRRTRRIVYAENPPQNEPRSGWLKPALGLRTGTQEHRGAQARRAARPLAALADPGRTSFSRRAEDARQIGRSDVPNPFRYSFDFKVDVDLAESCCNEARALSLTRR